MQIADTLQGIAEQHGHITGVVNLIGNMCIKPAHLTSDEDVSICCFNQKFPGMTEVALSRSTGVLRSKQQFTTTVQLVKLLELTAFVHLTFAVSDSA